MKKLYEKSELAFALVWIAVYCVLQSLAYPLNELIGVKYAANALFTAALSAALLVWIGRNGLWERYGLCGTSVPARRFLWYLPLLLMASHNLWNGAAVNMPAVETAWYICNMICVGFVEEVLFRGFLFRAIARDSVRQAVVISSVTFGMGHLLNLVNGRGMALAENLYQVVMAVSVGFLFVVIFYRGGSLIPCILTHSAIDVASAFFSEAGLTAGKHVLMGVSMLVIVAGYTLILTKTLPQGGERPSDGRPSCP